MIKQRIGVGLIVTACLASTLIYWKSTGDALNTSSSAPIRAIPFSMSSNNTPSLFLYRAYLSRTGQIRVYSINKCLSPNFSIIGKIGNLYVDFWAQPLEGQCPWHWAEECEYNAYILESSQTVPTTNITEITLYRGNKEIVLPIHHSVRKLKRGLTLCVPPLYWYTDWIKLIAFMEWWKVNGISKVIIYSHSTNKEVRTVLDYYKKQKILDLIEWPEIAITEKENPNLSLYRLGHSLAHNDCVQRIDTQIGALVDIDEMLIMRNKTLVSNIERIFKEFPSVGSLSFPHSVLSLNPPLYHPSHLLNFKKTDFHGFSSAKLAKINGPPKTIFRTKAVRRLSTHKVGQFEQAHWFAQTLNESNSHLLHNRYNYADGRKIDAVPINILPSSLSSKQFENKLISVMKTIFPKEAKFNPLTQYALGKCLGRWRSDGCKTPLTSCRDEMMKMEVWTFPDQSPSDTYRII